MTDTVAEKPQILVVDDSRVIRRAAAKMLGGDYQVHEAVDGMDGWQQLQRNDAISLVFADMQMPEMGGLELLACIRGASDEQLCAVPVVIITGVGDTAAAKREAFDAGATDFITKPFESIDLLSRAKSYTRLNRKLVELEKKSGHDELTGLFSLAGFEQQGQKAISFAIRHQLQLAAVYFEITGFQDLYLARGKSVAQKIISAVGKRLQETMRVEDIAARIGVARFAVLLPLTSESNAAVVIARIRECIEQLVFNIGQEKIRVSLAAGYTSADISKRQPVAEIMQQADEALQKALACEAGDKVCGFHQHTAAAESGVSHTQDDVRIACQHVLDGAYNKVPDHLLTVVAEKLAPFLDYVASRPDTGRTGTDGS